MNIKTGLQNFTDSVCEFRRQNTHEHRRAINAQTASDEERFTENSDKATKCGIFPTATCQRNSLLVVNVLKRFRRLWLRLLVRLRSSGGDQLNDLLVVGRTSVLEHDDATDRHVFEWNVP